jgi:hypothetical protein
MHKWYKANQGIIWLVTVIVALVSYAYTTFATVSYVDKKHLDIVGTLTEIKMDVRDTREKLYKLNGEVAPKLKE